MKTDWPETVPVLEAGDICRGASRDGERCCLLQWRVDVFGSVCSTKCQVPQQASLLIIRAAIELGASGIPHLGGIVEINDSPSNDSALLARIWNRAMARLGYVVNNPECTRSGKLKAI